MSQQRFLNLFYGSEFVGRLFANNGSTEFSFEYDSEWQKTGFSLSPKLPLSGAFSNEDVTYFFQNILPEGGNLDEIAQAIKISKSERFEILKHIGTDASGAFVLLPDGVDLTDKTTEIEAYDRPLSQDELSERLALRERRNFQLWDGKVRVSVAGFQDKIGIKVVDNQWFLPDGIQNHTSHILKPPPVNAQFESMVVNEAFCMALSQKIGLPTAQTQLVKVPEPVLLIERFDRHLNEHGCYTKRHVIDGCQLLGLPTNFKMERPYGATGDASQIREGASIAKLAEAIRLHSSMPIVDIKHFIDWIGFQLCIGNVDAHAKNVSFFVDAKSKIKLAPFYDQVCILDFEQLEERAHLNQADVDTNLAMAIGDEFDITNIGAYDIALMAQEAKLPIKSVVTSFSRVADSVLLEIEDEDSFGIPDEYGRLDSIKKIIKHSSQKLLEALKDAEQAFRDLD